MMDNLSKIGLGTYRMGTKPSHADVLKYAIDNGVNLIDTSSNYLKGESEKLIGKNLNALVRKDVFLISKVGYINSSDLSIIQKLKKSIQISNKSFYSIEECFIDYQINNSLKRLQTDYLDCYMLHNPEYLLLNKINEEDFYTQLECSLDKLNQLVIDGKIRFFGISSNNLHNLSTPRIKLEKLQIYFNKYSFLKFIQFPHNLIENNNNELIDLCKKNNVKTIANRPLTTKYNNRVIRIADYSLEVKSLDENKEQELFIKFKEIINKRLLEINESSKAEEYNSIKFLSENRKNIASPEALNQILKLHLFPFLLRLELMNDSNMQNVINKLIFYWDLFTKKTITLSSRKLTQELNLYTPNKSLSLIACEQYFNDGIDHVLVGMRKKQYIDDLKRIII